MKCPRCKNELQQVTLEDVTVDVCKGGCGGIWFDQFELKKFDEPHEAAGEALLDIERDDTLSLDYKQRINCPKCQSVIMMRHFSSVKRKVEVDECPGCGAFWLDYGELGRIRSLFKREAERKEAAGQYFNDVFGDDLSAMRAESAAKLAKARRIANIFRFICPSYYIPAKQEWGVF